MLEQVELDADLEVALDQRPDPVGGVGWRPEPLVGVEAGLDGGFGYVVTWEGFRG